MTSESSPSPRQLVRALGLWGAVMMGLGSMVGTGVFVSIGVAAGIAGPAVVLAIALAAVVAAFNALNSAQLAASHPVSGGTYEYGYRYLNSWLGFTAGWMFLCAKSASAATAALGFAGYALSAAGRTEGELLVPVAVAAVGVLTLVVVGGIRQSSRINVAIVSLALASLVFFCAVGAPRAIALGTGNLLPFFQSPAETEGGPVARLLHATALMFVAFTGYGRIATLGEEVSDPRRTIPRAIIVTMVLVSLLYMAVGAVGIGAAGAGRLYEATSEQAAPLQTVAREFALPGAHRFLAVGAITAMLGVLLNLILGLSRVLLAMGRRGDTPRATARLNAAGTTPSVAVIAVGVLIGGLALLGDVRTTWSFSAFTVLIYYAVTNLAALALPAEDRLYPRWLAWGGLAGCLFLAFWVEWTIWLAGLGLIAAGLVWHALARRRG